MPDREKVIGILSQFKTHIFGDKIYGGSVSVEEIIALLKEQEEVVRCKDCKHRPKEVLFTTSWNRTATYLEFPDDSKCPCQCSSDSYYSWYPADDWFCADGENADT